MSCPDFDFTLEYTGLKRPCQQPPLTPDEVTAQKIMIAQLEGALQKAMMGMQVRVLIDQNGERLEFTGVNVNTLKAYIETLKSQLPNYCANVAAPMRFFF